MRELIEEVLKLQAYPPEGSLEFRRDLRKAIQTARRLQVAAPSQHIRFERARPKHIDPIRKGKRC